MEKLEFDKNYMEIIENIPDNLSEYQYYLGLQERKLYFNDEVDLGTINKAVYWIMRWNEEDEKNSVPVDQRQEITLYVTSNGGCVISGLALVDAIKQSKTKVTTVGIGICASMGAILLVSGHERKAFKHTTVLFHDGSFAVQSSSKKAKQTVKYYERLDDKIKELVLEKTDITEEQYEEKEDEEWYLFAPECLELGVIDSIVE